MKSWVLFFIMSILLSSPAAGQKDSAKVDDFDKMMQMAKTRIKLSAGLRLLGARYEAEVKMITPEMTFGVDAIYCQNPTVNRDKDYVTNYNFGAQGISAELFAGFIFLKNFEIQMGLMTTNHYGSIWKTESIYKNNIISDMSNSPAHVFSNNKYYYLSNGFDYFAQLTLVIFREAQGFGSFWTRSWYSLFDSDLELGALASLNFKKAGLMFRSTSMTKGEVKFCFGSGITWLRYLDSQISLNDRPNYLTLDLMIGVIF